MSGGAESHFGRSARGCDCLSRFTGRLLEAMAGSARFRIQVDAVDPIFGRRGSVWYAMTLIPPWNALCPDGAELDSMQASSLEAGAFVSAIDCVPLHRGMSRARRQP